MSLPQAQETAKNHHATLEDVSAYLTGNELIVTTVRNHCDTVVSWWFLNNCYIPLDRFVTEYKHTFYAKGKELWWLHKKVDFVMRYETLQSDFDIVLLSLGLNPIQLGHENITTNKDNYRRHCSVAFLEAIHNRFSGEIQYYGYRL